MKQKIFSAAGRLPVNKRPTFEISQADDEDEQADEQVTR